LFPSFFLFDWTDVIWAITRMDATNKWPGETSREWGRTMQMTPEVTAKVDQMWQTLGL